MFSDVAASSAENFPGGHAEDTKQKKNVPSKQTHAHSRRKEVSETKNNQTSQTTKTHKNNKQQPMQVAALDEENLPAAQSVHHDPTKQVQTQCCNQDYVIVEVLERHVLEQMAELDELEEVPAPQATIQASG